METLGTGILTEQFVKEETPYQYEDTINLFDYGFGNFQIVNIAESDSKYAIDNAFGFCGSTVSVFWKNDSYLLPRVK